MSWKNLNEDIAEEFSSVGVDARSLYNDGLRWTRPEADQENRSNYMRWYRKQVWYPKNRDRVLSELKEEYNFHKVMQDDWWKKWKEYRKKRLTPGTAAHKKQLEYTRDWKKRAYASNPEYKKLVLQKNAERRRLRKEQDPEYHERYKAYQREYSAKRRANGQKTTGCTGQ